MSPIQTPRRHAFDAYTQKFADRLISESEMDLLTFQSTLMEQPLPLWNNNANMLLLIRDRKLSIEAMKIVVDALKHRWATGCFREMEIWLWEKFGCVPYEFATIAEAVEGVEPDYFDRHFYKWARNICTSIGERYEEQKEKRNAIPWYKIALEYGFKAYLGLDREILARLHHDLGEAHEKAGFFRRALKCYDHGLTVNSKYLSKARDRLLNEMKK